MVRCRIERRWPATRRPYCQRSRIDPGTAASSREGAIVVGVNRRDEVLLRHRETILAAAERNNALTIALVGSVARGEDNDSSDYDFLVEFRKGVTLFDIGGLQADLEDVLGASVDVVPKSCVRRGHTKMFEDAIHL